MLWIIIKVAFRSLWAAKLRSFLAILGIIMGVGAVISMMSIIEGASRQIEKMIGSMGTDVLYIYPSMRSATGKQSVAQLKIGDAEALLLADAVIRVSPVLQTSVTAKRNTRSQRLSVSGMAPTMFVIRNLEMERGRAFSDTEVRQDAPVIILGSKAAEKLFGKEDPLEQSLKINQRTFRVIGVLKSKGMSGFNNDDDSIIAPFTTVLRQMSGRGADLTSICIQAGSTEELRIAEDQVRTILRRRHGMRPSEKDDFSILNQAQMIAMRGDAIKVLGIVLGGVGGICLLTGGIGIMNIMLVIVTERTREIGLRKAVGAKGFDILFQFLLEAVVLSGLGGVLGVVGGWGLSQGIRALMQFETVVSPTAVVMAVAFATGVGIFFGFYPAWRASRLDPIQALHVE